MKKESLTNFIRNIINEDLNLNPHMVIRTRFSPEPNGYLHIGHAKSIFLNFEIARDYQGKCNLRFDDTNPEKENIEYVNAIQHDIKWLGFDLDEDSICYTSNYFKKLYDYALELIHQGLAYVDELSLEDICKYRGNFFSTGKNSPYRERSIKKNLYYFSKMREGKFSEGSACLRAKIDMTSPFIILRDPVLYRIKFSHHYNTGNEWCIYPTYDFAHCISDAIENITHSLCTLEFADNRRLYDWILRHISLHGSSSHPKQYEFSRLNIKYCVMSKRTLNLLVTEKVVDGWDDPRMPTISGFRRRGYTASSIRKFCHRIGVTKQENYLEIAALEACIRDELNETAPRALAVLNPIQIVFENLPLHYEEYITMFNHPTKPDMGHRLVMFSQSIYIDRSDFLEKANKNYKRLVLGEKIKLRHAYIIQANSVKKDKNGNISLIYCTCDMNSLNKSIRDIKEVRGIIHWVSAKKSISAEFRLYNNLFLHPNPDPDNSKESSIESISHLINPNSLLYQYGYVENSLISTNPGAIYQFERVGYFCIDINCSSSEQLIFNRTVKLRSNWK
ncbi:glutamine--tRNA ligase [Candidatus Schneideria nysicola]|uniref:glutamine--tRNA ligase n=1 Tax=Candidatus Schneideria nysicola TaxID=1081631 RepID=UPI003B968E6C